jgi:cell pole-organizing protein PopZ
MTQPAKSQEPSMEEILASIRRIIADDDANKTAPRPAPAPEPPKAVAPAPPPRPAPPVPRVAPPRIAPPEPSLDEPTPAMAFEPAEPEPAVGTDDQSSDILDLTESMATPSPAAQFRTIDGNFDISYEDEKLEPPHPEPEPEPYRTFDSGERGEERNQLLSSVTSAAVDSAFNTLAQTVLVQNARTLEDLVREMLRPMLKAWLDDNLPGMVERLVRAEIERVSRGRMG